MMACLPRSKSSRGENKVQDEVKYVNAKRLYAHLEEIAQSGEDIKDSDLQYSIIDAFKTYFKIQNNSHHLLKNDLLQSLITNLHRDNSADRLPKKIDGKTLLLQAMSIRTVEGSNKHKTLKKVVEVLVKNAPEMMFKERKCDNQENNGITPLHLAILKGDLGLLEDMKEKYIEKGKRDIKNDEIKNKVKDIDANGTKFHDTVMMAGTLLGVATLTFNKEIFKVIIFHFFSDLCVTNSKGDNIVHSLIKYAHLHPDFLDKSMKMLTFILESKWNDCIPPAYETTPLPPGKARDKTRQLLICQNKEGLTPLQLAAKRQQFRMFEQILQHEAYRSTDSSDGLFDEEEYDITEIDTIAPNHDIKGTEHEVIKSAHHTSILEYVITHQTNSAFQFTNCFPVRQIIETKWNYYRCLFWSWFVLHFVFMGLLTAASLRRSKIQTSVFDNGNVTENNIVFVHTVTEDVFVTSVGTVGVAIGVVFLFWEFIRRAFIRRFQAETSSKWYLHFYNQLTIPYSNTIFEIYFVLFSLCLVIDFVLAITISGYENYCLIFAVIIGWSLVLFFIQTFKVFSFFTVLIQRVILDLGRFSIVMTIFLVSFSAAMSMVMQGANTTADDFDSFDKTLIKMLNIMLGIGDLDILFNARHPTLAVFIFVMFVLLTTILLLNALIALMSNSCTDLMSSNDGVVATEMHCCLQKLSVILFLESYLPKVLCKSVGVERAAKRSEDHRKTYRRFWSESSLQYSDKFDDDSKPFTLGTLTKGVKSKVKKSRKRQQSVSTIFIDDTPRLERSLEIKEMDRVKCGSCQNDTVVGERMFTQEIMNKGLTVIEL